MIDPTPRWRRGAGLRRDGSQPRVLYIVGSGRSASTLLDQILGQVESWFSCGELWAVWRNRLCGCGVHVFDCDFWHPVLTAVTSREGIDPSEMLALQREELGTSPVKPLTIWRERRRRLSSRPPAMRYPEVLTRLYEEIRSSAGAGMIVDSSKIATRAYLIASLTEIDLHVVHLVRDPRALAYAWSKEKPKYPDRSEYLGQLSPMRSSFEWLRRHAAIELVLRKRLGPRYLQLRYEDFVAAPEAAVRSICAFVGEPDAEVPFVDSRSVRLEPNHTVAGNLTRFAAGVVSIRADQGWRTGLSARSRLLATAVAAPLMRRYGYPVLRS